MISVSFCFWSESEPHTQPILIPENIFPELSLDKKDNIFPELTDIQKGTSFFDKNELDDLNDYFDDDKKGWF